MAARRLVVAHHRPWTAWIQLLALAATLAAVTVTAYVYGRATVALEFTAARDERDRLRDQVTGLKGQNMELRERIAVLERAAQIDRQAYTEVDEYVVELQSEIYSLREEVGFYRGIVSSPNGQGLQIQSFEVKSTPQDGSYRYHLVLTQDLKNDKVVSCLVVVSVSGLRSGQVIRLTGDQISPGAARDAEFRFRHFQRIEGTFALPVGFEPRSVLVEVVDTDERKTVTEKQFDWRWPIG